jgi:predicted dehydrogenase
MIETVGFVGAGAHVREVLLPAAVAAGFRPTGVAARTVASAQAASAPYGATAFSSVVELVAAPDVDAIVVAVPPDQFGAVLPTVLVAGKPCYVEKPGAISSADALAFADLAKRCGTRVQVGYMKRYGPAYVSLREAMTGEEFGPVSLVTVRWAMGPFGGRRTLDDWLIENGVHAFDLARYLVGDFELRNVLVQQIKGEHVVLIQGMSAAGTPVTLQLCTTGPWWHDNETVEVFGIGSSLLVSNASVLVSRDNDGPERVSRPNFTIPVQRNLTGTLLGFTPALQALRDDTGAGPDLRDAAAVLAMVEHVIAVGA